MRDLPDTWTEPTWTERNGEAISMLIGAAVFGLALGMLGTLAVIA